MSDDVFPPDSALLSLATPLGAHALVPANVRLEEAFNQPFTCTIDVVSSRAVIDSNALLHKPVCLRLRPPESVPRFVHGMVRQVTATGGDDRDTHCWRLEVVPRLWFLSQAEDCRVFEDKSAQQILNTLLDDAGITDVTFAISQKATMRPLTVQYNESNLAFFTRLIEQEGWFYLFRHTDKKHTLVVADGPSAYINKEGGSHVHDPRYSDPSADQLTAFTSGCGTASGEVLLGDYNADDGPIETSTKTRFQAAGADKRKVYRWADVGSKRCRPSHARLRMEAAEAASSFATGESCNAAFLPGVRFVVAGGPAAGPAPEFVVLSVVHEATDPAWANATHAPGYSNRFTAHPTSLPWRPLPTVPRPNLVGMHSAKVIGPAGEEIHTDHLGRVKLRFRWDHRGEATDTAGVWVRVMQPWGGNGFGFMAIPRVGYEVAVSFMDGDPDRPVVVGHLYSADQPPPSLPAQKTRTGLRTRSSPGGGSNDSSELWFDDKKDEELVFLHAQRDLTVEVENCARTTVDGSRTTRIKSGSDKLTLDEGSRETTISKGNDQLTVSKGHRTVEVPLGDHTITSETGDITLRTKGGAITLEAMKSLTLKVGQSSIKLEPSGISISGMQVKVEGLLLASVKGPLVELNADGILKAAGTLITLN